MYRLDDISYSATLRGKAGEFLACRHLDDAIKDRLLPTFVLPPLTAPENSGQTLEGVMALQMSKIFAHWRSRPCLLDLRFLKFDPDGGIDANRISQLLETARNCGCHVIPIIDLTNEFHRVSAIGAHSIIAASGAALRVTLADLNQELKQLLDTQVANLGTPSSDCLLVLDFSGADLSESGEFATFANEWLLRLRGFGMWPRIVFESTNYPLKNPAPANGAISVTRAEWSTWKRVLDLDPNVRDFVLFGDFGADHADIDFEADGRAITHLRYTTGPNWLIVRGDKKRETIRSVAERIVKSGSFSGEMFSWGDEFVATRAAGLAGIGSPTIWRAVNMNHHMTHVTNDLGTLYGRPVSRSGQRRQPVQRPLFSPLNRAAPAAE
jgi:hypothetical protein